MLAVDDFLYVFVSAESFEESDGLVGLLETLKSILDYQG